MVGFIIPLVFIAGIVFCLGALLWMGYRNVTASAFFDVKKIEISGTEHTSNDAVENIIQRQAARSGVWNADLDMMKSDIEKLTYIKSAAVSRILPDGVKVVAKERTPLAVIRLEAGEYWVDEEGVQLGQVAENDGRPPFFLSGWDETKTLKAIQENRERVRVYRQMLQDWQDFALAKRVSEVGLENPEAPVAVVRDSGQTVKIFLGKDNYGKSLRDALKAIANKGKEIESYDVQNSVARPRKG